jgi:hypothetical protein
MPHSRLTEKPRVVFLREMHRYREEKKAYYAELVEYEDMMQRLITEELEGLLRPGAPAVALSTQKAAIGVPVHPLCPSKFLTSAL